MRKRELRSPSFKLYVTREIIERAQVKDSAHCMIAEAVKAARPEARFVSVDLQTIRFTEQDRRYVYLTPRVAQVALIRFDQGVKQEPWEVGLANGQSTEARVLTKSGKRQRRSKARLVDSPSGTDAVPLRVGGAPPPRIPGGNRRAYGLRALQV